MWRKRKEINQLINHYSIEEKIITVNYYRIWKHLRITITEILVEENFYATELNLLPQ